MKKVMSCILSFLPLVSFVVLISTIILLALYIPSLLGEDLGTIVVTVYYLLGILVEMALVYGMMGWYLYRACKSTILTVNQKILWCILLCGFTLFTYPVFWFVHIRKGNC